MGNAATAAIRAYQLPKIDVPGLPIDIATPVTSLVVGDIPQTVAPMGLAQSMLPGLRAQAADLQARNSAGTVSTGEFYRELASIKSAINGLNLANASGGSPGGVWSSGSSMGRPIGGYENGELNVNIYGTGGQMQASPITAGSDSTMSGVSYDSVRDVVGRGLLPTITAFGERGIPGTWGSKFVGAGKQLWNTALGMYDLMSGGALASSLTGVPSPASLSQAYIADNELAGAAIVEGGLFVLPTVAGKVGRLGRLGEIGGELRVADRTPQISGLQSISAEEANAPFIKRGWFSPYESGTRPRVFSTESELDFVRVHGPNNVEGRFMVRAEEIGGMSPVQIREHLALEYTPTHISDVKVPMGTQMQVGRVGSQPQWGVPSHGGIQYQLLQDVPSNSFWNTRPLR